MATPHSQGGGGDEGVCLLVVADRHGAGGQGPAVAILRAGVGARARAKSSEMSEFKFVFGVALYLFLAIALTPSASEPSPVLVVGFQISDFRLGSKQSGARIKTQNHPPQKRWVAALWFLFL